MTSSLFATTLVASFFVVAMPHLLPCPVPRTKYADGEVVVDENGRRRRWRRKDTAATENTGSVIQFNQITPEDSEQSKRICPVPKPGGMLGEWLGFHSADDESKRTGR